MSEISEAMSESKTKARSQKDYFKTRYYANPEYKKRHLEKMKEKLYCPDCDVYIGKCNINNHNNTNKHKLKAQIKHLQEEKHMDQ